MTIPVINNQPYFYWHLEVSSKCSLRCPRCPRTEKIGQYKVTEHTLDFIKKVFTDEILKKTKKILICGGQGDPIYCKDLIAIVKYLKNKNRDIQINIITNGSYKTTEWWESLAENLNSKDIITFSIDGWDNTSNNLYRVNSDFDSILNGIKTVKNKNLEIKITWSTIVFSFNENNIDLIKKLAKDTGADYFQLVRSSLFGNNYKKYIDEKTGKDLLMPSDISNFRVSDRQYMFNLKTNKKITEDDLLDENITDDLKVYYNYYIDLFNLYSKVKNQYLENNLLPSCLLNERGLYIDAEGILYPCSWISHPFGERSHESKTIKWKDSLFVKHKDKFNLHKYSFETILKSEYWQKLHNSFNDPTKTFVECRQKCNRKASFNRLIGSISLNSKIKAKKNEKLD